MKQQTGLSGLTVQESTAAGLSSKRSSQEAALRPQGLPRRPISSIKTPLPEATTFPGSSQLGPSVPTWESGVGEFPIQSTTCVTKRGNSTGELRLWFLSRSDDLLVVFPSLDWHPAPRDAPLLWSLSRSGDSR